MYNNDSIIIRLFLYVTVWRHAREELFGAEVETSNKWESTVRYPREPLQFFAYIPGAIWTIQDRWPYDLHDLTEWRFTYYDL